MRAMKQLVRERDTMTQDKLKDGHTLSKVFIGLMVEEKV
jgi:hypothetical protein